MTAETDKNLTATHLLFDPGKGTEYSERTGECCFCGSEGVGIHVDEVVSRKYFTEDDLLTAPESNHTCAKCAQILDEGKCKTGHWIAHGSAVETPSTGELLEVFARLRRGEIPVPFAMHVTSSPIRSSHSYLWAPVNVRDASVEISYDRDRVRIRDWEAFTELIAVIEDFRVFGFTFDEIRSGEPRAVNLHRIGRARYRNREQVLAPHRRTARLELALTVSRSASDQPRDDGDPRKEVGVEVEYDPLTNVKK